MLGQFLFTLVVYGTPIFVLIVVPNFFLKSKNRPDRKMLGLIGWPLWKDIALALAGFVIYLILSYIFLELFAHFFPWFQAEEIQSTGFESTTSRPDLIFAFLSLVVVAPIAEEILFRGLLYGRLLAIRFKSGKNFPRWLAILIVSALFAYFHGQWNVAISVFALSIVLCVLRDLTGTLHSSIILHILKNAVAFAITFNILSL